MKNDVFDPYGYMIFKILVPIILLTYSCMLSAEGESNRFEIYSLNCLLITIHTLSRMSLILETDI